MKAIDILDTAAAVSILNEDYQHDDYILFQMKTDSYSTIVQFCGFVIWSSEDDDRWFDEDENEYELLMPFLLKKAENIMNTLYTLMNKTESGNG